MAKFTIDLLRGELYLFNTEISGSTGSSNVILYSNSKPTPNTIGGIPAGTIFDNKTMIEMWNMLLYPVQYPTLTMPNNTFQLMESGLHVVGEIIPTLNFISSFSRGVINPSYGTSGYRSGLPNNYHYSGSGLPANVVSSMLSNNQTISNYVVLLGVQTWDNFVSYDMGEQPKDSNGNDYDVPLPAGTTSMKTVSITGVYQYYATTSNITTLTMQPLSIMDAEYVEIDMVGESGGNKQRFELPIMWSPITGIKFYNTISNTWDWIGGSKSNSLATFTITDNIRNINGIDVSYKLWTHNGSTIGSRKLRLYTT